MDLSFCIWLEHFFGHNQHSESEGIGFPYGRFNRRLPVRHQVATFCFRPEFCTCGTVGWETTTKKACQRFKKINRWRKSCSSWDVKDLIIGYLPYRLLYQKIARMKIFTALWLRDTTFLRTAGVKFSAPGFLKPKNCPNKDGHQRVPQPLLQGFSTGVARSYKNPVFSTKNMSNVKKERKKLAQKQSDLLDSWYKNLASLRMSKARNVKNIIVSLLSSDTFHQLCRDGNTIS